MVGERFRDPSRRYATIFGPILVGMGSLAITLGGCSVASKSPPALHIELHLDCLHGPREATAGALNAAQERTIVIRDEDQTRTLHAYAGAIAIESGPAKPYTDGSEILDFDPVTVIAGAPDHQPDGRYIDSQSALTAVCKPSMTP